jgi:hypothetical protein
MREQRCCRLTRTIKSYTPEHGSHVSRCIGMHLFSLSHAPTNKSRIYWYFSTLKRKVSHTIIDKCKDFHKIKFHKSLFITIVEKCYSVVQSRRFIFRIICDLFIILFMYVDDIFEQIYSLSCFLNEGTKHFTCSNKYAFIL